MQSLRVKCKWSMQEVLSPKGSREGPTVLSQGVLQRGHHTGGRLQPDDVVGDREGQFHRLDQQLALRFPITGLAGGRTALKPALSLPIMVVKL